MDAKKFLMQVKKLDRMIENKREERDQWLLLATNITAGDAPATGVRVQTSGSQQKMADAIDRSIDIGAQIEQTIRRLFEARQEIISVIEQLSAVEYDLLHRLYVGKIVVDPKTRRKRIVCMTLQEVADEYGRSHSWARTLHGVALSKVRRIIEEKGVVPIDEQIKRWNCEKV